MTHLQPWDEGIWNVDGPDVNFISFPYPTRMVVVRIRDSNDSSISSNNNDNNNRAVGGAWLWSPIPWSLELQTEIEAACQGPICFIVSPNKIHWLFLNEWHTHCPEARVLVPPGLAERKVLPKELRVDATLTDAPESGYAEQLNQVILKGFLPEMVFFHRPSRTLIVCDYIQRFSETDDKCQGCKGWLLRMGGVVGPNGTAPSDLRLATRLTGGLPALSTALDRIRAWNPEKLIIAHGENVHQDAMVAIEMGFRWIPSSSRTKKKCFCFSLDQNG